MVVSLKAQNSRDCLDGRVASPIKAERRKVLNCDAKEENRCLHQEETKTEKKPITLSLHEIHIESVIERRSGTLHEGLYEKALQAISPAYKEYAQSIAHD